MNINTKEKCEAPYLHECATYLQQYFSSVLDERFM